MPRYKKAPLGAAEKTMQSASLFSRPLRGLHVTRPLRATQDILTLSSFITASVFSKVSSTLRYI